MNQYTPGYRDRVHEAHRRGLITADERAAALAPPITYHRNRVKEARALRIAIRNTYRHFQDSSAVNPALYALRSQLHAVLADIEGTHGADIAARVERASHIR